MRFLHAKLLFIFVAALALGNTNASNRVLLSNTLCPDARKPNKLTRRQLQGLVAVLSGLPSNLEQGSLDAQKVGLLICRVAHLSYVWRPPFPPHSSSFLLLPPCACSFLAQVVDHVPIERAHVTPRIILSLHVLEHRGRDVTLPDDDDASAPNPSLCAFDFDDDERDLDDMLKDLHDIHQEQQKDLDDLLSEIDGLSPLAGMEAGPDLLGECTAEKVHDYTILSPAINVLVSEDQVILPNGATIARDHPVAALLLEEAYVLICAVNKVLAGSELSAQQQFKIQGLFTSVGLLTENVNKLTPEQFVGGLQAFRSTVDYVSKVVEEAGVPSLTMVHRAHVPADINGKKVDIVRLKSDLDSAQRTRASRRRGLIAREEFAARGSYNAEDGNSATQWVEKAIAISTLLIVLYGLVASVYMMINMPLDKDTLLYSRKQDSQ